MLQFLAPLAKLALPAIKAVAPTLLSAGASYLSGKKQADTIGSAASAQAQAQAEALKIQQENLARNYALLAPIANNQRRFVGLAQAAAGGSGYLPQALPSSFNAIGKSGAAAQQEADLDGYIDQNPWLEGYWNSWEAGGAAKGKYTHRQQFGDFRGYAKSEFDKGRPQAAPQPARQGTPMAPQGQSYLAKPTAAAPPYGTRKHQHGDVQQAPNGAWVRWNEPANRFEPLG
jgi:hypothetical protein